MFLGVRKRWWFASAAALLEAPKQSLEAGAAADADMDAQAVTKREDSGTQEAVQPRKATQMAKRRRR